MPKKILSLLLTLVLALSLCLPASAAAPEASPREAAAAAYGALFDKNELEANTKNAKIIWLLSFDAAYKAGRNLPSGHQGRRLGRSQGLRAGCCL